MFRPTCVFAVISVVALLGNFTTSAFGAAAGKGGVNHRGGRADERMSAKGAANTNAQWSADPDRGWVRADERHKLNEKPGSSNPGKNQEKQKGKGKGKKF
jgi:hypothetical protein